MQLSALGRLAPVVALALSTAPSWAHADGEVTAGAMYYKEEATRVTQPMIDATLDVGERGTADAHFLIDAISSASAGAFDETRYQAGGAYRHQLARLRLGGQVRFSTEPDYRSLYGAVEGDTELLDKNLTLSLTLGVGHDDINNSGLGALAPRVEGTLDTLLASVGVSQLLGEHGSLSLTYDLSRLDGLQHNLYRRVVVNGTSLAENHPDLRTRHALAGTLKWFFPSMTTTVIGQYRFYADDWGLHAHTPEVRVLKDVGDWVTVGLRYRHHRQDAADFYQARYSVAQELLSADAKLSAFDGHLLGGRLEVSGGALGLTGRLEQTRGELVGEYVIQHNAFGNALVTYAYLVFPFEY
jgi:Protein of unknown function (DUF3570)